jgi:Ser/Thr protein kinase RdoA (MazF antagonist)
MKPVSPARALTIARAFSLPGVPTLATPFGSGHINDTFLVSPGSEGVVVRYVLQRINSDVFSEAEKVMENVERVTTHLTHLLEAEGRPDASRRALRLVPSREGRYFTRDEEGHVWRIYHEIPGSRTWDVAGSADRAREAARAYARFSRQMASLPGERLNETIPSFHDTRSRFSAFTRAVERDPLGRAGEANREIAAFARREALTLALSKPMAAGQLVEGVAHNDTKVNNVLFDETTGEGLCVLDLDTVMPGFFLNDFGDLVRSASNPAREDGSDLTAVRVDEEVFESLVQGTMDELGDVLTPLEQSLLVTSGKVLCYELGMRFLTDFLLGDCYFRIHRRGQNLDRARVHLALLESMEEREESLEEIAARAEREVRKDRHG